MPEFTLTAAPPLAGYDRDFGAVTLKAPEHLAIVSIALPLGGEDAAKKAIKAAFGVNLPEVGRSDVAKDKSAALMRLSSDQAFALFPCETPDAERQIAAKLDGAAYTTDQSDVWCALEISGTGARAALERICMIDLHPDAFALNAIARTVMEHLGVIIARTGDNTYLLLSASSSAQSFLHALETSIENTQ
ncbi:sarcosine oxidase subunit gamma [Roseovarius spongiae]|uniref:Sarcosine oxidase subunit gamma n=1 Tax=Roseovarius spongiae TaxID=2320272 RepID=A0A3A8B8U2_9RHOB|nr:sarcosine oxidase subunit gamma family protein [Roseovarius spongiae]RKF14128.1 sarcosine oxidase subunit gamma [Roseovarius spongiae]